MRRHYELLGIEEGADESKIRQAYRRLAFEYHPDRNASPEANQTFIAIKEAYDCLMGHSSQGLDTEIYAFKQAFQEWQREETDARLRREERRKQAREEARRRYEAFLANNRIFRNSWYFYPAMLLAYSILYINRLVSILLFLAPVIGLVWMGITWQVVLPASIICWLFAFRLLSLATLYRDEISPYFFAPHQPVFRT